MTTKTYGPTLPISEERRCCNTCKKTKSLDNFHKDSKATSGVSYRCKDCAKKASKDWRGLNPEKSREKIKELFLLNKDKYYNSHKDRQLEKKYSITRESYEQMLHDTGGQCRICSRVFGTRAYTKPVIDHCHETGKTRGLICRQCNIGLGAFRDNTDALTNAIKYLEDTKNEN